MAKTVLLVWLVVYLVLKEVVASSNLKKFIDSQGYLFENHTVITESGYILGLHNIPGPKKSSSANKTKPVVLLQHGLATSADCWVLSGHKSALAFQLVNLGYDVWMSNSRGTVYSNNHTKLDMNNAADRAKFNHYSFHEKGNEDLLANIDYILKITKVKNLALYAHSEGASMFFALGATQPKQLTKINSFFGFAPLVFIGNPASPVVALSALAYRFYLFGYVYNFVEPMLGYAIRTLNSFSGNMITQSYTTIPISFIAGGDQGQIDGGTISRLYKYFPSNVNKRSLFHLLQLVNSGSFHHFLYAPFDIRHLRQVLSLRSKRYDLKTITTPMYLYFSEKDLFINVTNLKLFDRFFSKKPKVFNVHNNFGHYDFVYGKDAINVYELTFDALAKHAQHT